MQEQAEGGMCKYCWRRLDGLKKLHKIVAAADVQWECF